jgi:hypothetical protein
VSAFTSAALWQVTHDDARGGAHEGTIAPASVVHPPNVDSTDNHDFLIVTCPVCQSVSTHPAGGGAQAPSVQQMFVTVAQSDGCPCDQVDAADPDGLAASHVRLQVNRMDGPGHWQLTSDTDLRLSPDQTTQSFEVVYVDPGDGLIVGMNPEGSDLGTDHQAATLTDAAEYDMLVNTDPAYLSADKQKILSSPDH